MDIRRRNFFAKSCFNGFAAVAALILSLITPAALHADGLDLAYQPMRVELRLTPAQVQTGVIQLKNQGAQPVHLRVRMMDFYASSDNTPQFAIQNDEAYSCRKWTTLNPTEVDVTANAVVPFRYTMQVPSNLPATARTFRCAVVFESMPTLEDRLQKRAANQVRLVTVLYATIGNPVSVPAIGDPEITKGEKGWHLHIPFANSGETFYRLTGDILINDAAGKTLQTIEMDSSPVHPQTNVAVEFPIEALTNGEYTMQIQLKTASKILVKEAVLEVADAR